MSQPRHFEQSDLARVKVLFKGPQILMPLVEMRIDPEHGWIIISIENRATVDRSGKVVLDGAKTRG